MILILFLFFFVTAENSSSSSQNTNGMAVLPFENETVNSEIGNEKQENKTLENETLNEKAILPFENTSREEFFEVDKIPPETDSPLETLPETPPETTEENKTPITNLITNETNPLLESTASIVSNNPQIGNVIDYTLVQEGEQTHLYPSMLIDEIQFSSLSGSPTIRELGKTIMGKQIFITTFIFDTSTTTFTKSNFTKRVEGKELYICNQWEDITNACITNWTKVQDLSGEEYTSSIQQGVIAYGETIAPQPMGINSDMSTQSAISSTLADGLIAYGELNIAIPRFRTWNSSNNFSAEQNAQTIGTSGTDDITWVVTKANHERDEIIIGTEDKSNDINIQRNNSTRGWDNRLEVTANISNSAYRAFDIAVEDISGDVLIVYEGTTAADSIVYYRTWNGTNYSAEQTLTTSLTGNPFFWVALEKRPGSNDIMLLAHISTTNDLYAVPWNGTSFDTSKEQIISNVTASNIQQHFAFSWQNNGGGLVGYAVGTNLVYRQYLTNGSWSGASTVALGTAMNGLRLCNEPSSDYIGIIYKYNTGGSTSAGVQMWNGTAILPSPPTAETSVEPIGANNVNVDCAWYNSTNALFGFIDNAALTMDYFTFAKPSSWNITTMATTPTTATIAADDIGGLRFTKHPTTSEIMVIEQDILEDVRAVVWNGTGFVIPPTSIIEGVTEVINAAQESAMFDWYRYDPIPNVTSISPSGTSYSPSKVILINATIIDNIAVDTVLANVTLPNGSIQQITLTNSTNATFFNSTFSTTASVGTYTIQIVANDTSSHQNVNSSETTTFSIAETTPPIVTGLLPVNQSTFNISNVIEIAANVTDNLGVSTVKANITYPNGTTEILNLSLATGTKYNVSFSPPSLLGNYNITFIANDTSNNRNASEKTNFTLQDTVKPNVTGLIPTVSSVFNTSNVIEIAANVTDDLAVSTVRANVTHPDGTAELLNLSLAIGTKYNTSFSIPNAIGVYNVTILANDSSNNINNSQKTNFTVNDIILPAVTITTPLVGSSFGQNTSIIVTVTITDNVAVSTVLANITAPNGSVFQQVLISAGGDSYNNVTFNDTNTIGTYLIRVIANDTSNNINSTVTRTFSIQDSTAPLVTLILPLNGTQNNSQNINFKCNATDNVGLRNITFYINSSGTFQANTTNATITGSANETTFPISLIDGTYKWNCQANDTEGNSAFAGTNFTILIDTTPPSVTGILPLNSSFFNITNVVEIAANISDASGVSTVKATITYPNSSEINVTLSLTTGTKYNTSFTVPALLGVYNITILTNDTFNNFNNSEKTNFTVNDVNTLSITIGTCTPALANISQTIRCNSTITDDVGISSVQVNITLPNGTIQTQTVDNSSSIYNITFNNSVLVGNYTVLWWVNDTSNNAHSNTSSFVINETISPIITLNTPANLSNTSSTSATFNFTATDNYYTTLNCSLYLNGTLNTTNATTINGSNTLVTIDGIADGSYNWNVSCQDNSSNSNSSTTKIFTVDTGKPLFHSLTTTPSSPFDLDPNVNITLRANVSDNITTIDTVILQYKLDSESTYNNITGVPNNGVYNGTFNATQSGMYNLRIWANDSVGNNEYSNLVNITVQFDRNWTRTPSAFAAVATTLNSNVTLGNITINNTGDYDLLFNITSNSNQTTFNESSYFNLTAGAVKQITVYDNGTVAGIKNIILNISVNDTLANPTSQTTTASVVVAPGQPILVSTFTTPSTESISVTQGQNNVEVVVKLENIGEGNASNVSHTITLPDGWTVTFGSATVNYTTLDSGENEENTILFSIPSNATIGDYNLSVNSTGINATGANLTTLNLTYGDTITVSVEAQTTALGRAVTSETTTEETSSSLPSSGTTGGGGGGSALPGEKAIITSEVFNILRGEKQTFPIKVRNIYSDSKMNNVQFKLEGFLAKYVTWTPSKIDNIATSESGDFYLTITVPDYFTESEYELTATITADVFPLDPKAAGYTSKKITEQRKIILRIAETSEEDLSTEVNIAEQCLNEISEAGFNTIKVKDLLEQAKEKIAQHNSREAKEILNEICKNKKMAFDADDLIKKIEEQLEEIKTQALIGKAYAIDLKTPETLEAVNLAKLALERGDFELALERIKSAQLDYVLETAGTIDVIRTLKDYWWIMITSLFVLLLVGAFGYQRLRLAIMRQQLKNMDEEELNIKHLLSEAQRDYLQKKIISSSQYERYRTQYLARLNKIKQTRAKLQSTKVRLMDPQQMLIDLKKERQSLESLMKKSQTSYLLKGTKNRGEFKDETSSLATRLAETYKEEQIIKGKIKRHQKRTRFFFIINKIFSFGQWKRIPERKDKVKKENIRSKKNSIERREDEKRI